MHHMNAEEINTFWHFERRKQRALAESGSPSRPLVLKDIFDEFLAPHLNATREDWDNMADNRFYLDLDDDTRKWEEWQTKRMKKPEGYNEFEKRAHLSFEDCGAACRSLPYNECFRYRYQNGACAISNSFIMGKPVKREDKEGNRIMSGWDVEKIHAWIQKQGSCDKIKWPDVKG
jgi:hypothetical protein